MMSLTCSTRNSFSPSSSMAAGLLATVASVENLRKKEQENYFWRSGSRVQAKDVNDPNTFKVRKAKVGGYRDYFDDDQVAELNQMVDSRLLPVFGYTTAEQQ